LRHFADDFDAEYAVPCFRAGSSFDSPACNCLGSQKPAELDSRPIVTIVAPSWLGGAVDAWLLKILIEERLGWPVALISDLDSRFDGVPSIYQAMVHGDVHIYPEASARLHGTPSFGALQQLDFPGVEIGGARRVQCLCTRGADSAPLDALDPLLGSARVLIILAD
jgi:hypothetical protein